MRPTAETPATTPIPVQLSASALTACIGPHLAMPKRGPKGTLGDHRVLTLIVWGLDTGRQWKSRPVPTDPMGKPALHSPTVAKGLAQWADDGSRWHAFVARVAPRSAAKHRARSIRPGDGTTTVAPTGGRAWATPAPNTSKGPRSAP